MTARVASCPHCGTTFKVVADQLRLRAGWVRCGVCGQVFDASEPHLAVHTDEPRFSADDEVPQPVRPKPATGSREPQPLEREPFGDEPLEHELPAIFHVPEARLRSPVAHEPREPSFNLSAPDDDAADAQDGWRGHGRQGHDQPTLTLPPLLRRGRPSAFMRACWSTGLLLALLALLGQTLWWWRTPIATYVPMMRPALEGACATLGCTVGYVRKPGQLSIESSSVQPGTVPFAGASGQAAIEGQALVLSALLRNRAGHAQSWPALELSLTDYSDTVVMRRALMPHEYLRTDVAARPFAAHSEQQITVEFTALSVPVSGYRVALFFP